MRTGSPGTFCLSPQGPPQPGFLPQLFQSLPGGPRPSTPPGRIGRQAAGHLLLDLLLPGPPQLGLLLLLLLLPLPGLQQAPWAR